MGTPEDRGSIQATDPDGLPLLVDVVLSGDEARRRGIRIPRRPVAEAPAQASAPSRSESLEGFLQERIEQALRRALPEATDSTVRKLRAAVRKRRDQRRGQ